MPTTKTRTDLAATWPPTAAAAREAGHVPLSPLKAIRAKCLDCANHQTSEIRRCESINCSLWPFRAAQHPWRLEFKKTASSGGVFERGDPIQQQRSRRAST